MCGIAGIVSFADRYVPDEALLRRMSARIAHRGPDGEGIEIVRGGGGSVAGFAHRRLAILDPDPRSNQPFSAEHGGRRVLLTYNGEIYNYRELRKRLETELPGYEWKTTGDTEVVAAAYLAWGARFVEELLGMFALAIFDIGEGSVLLARDLMGQKPLYVALAPDAGGVAFASELSALTAVSWVDTTICERALEQYLAFGYSSPLGTIYSGVRKLPPAHRLTLGRDGRANAEAYFTARGTPASAGHSELEARRLTEAAVASQLVSDVPLGCFLSGGIDSSVVALCAHGALQREGKRLRTFTARFDDPRYDESPFAAEVARHLGTDHTEFRVTPDAAADLPALADSYGEPFGDSSCLPTYYLSRETRKHVKVALAGDGGDELFCGYDRYRAMALAERWGPLARLADAILGGKRLARGHPKRTLTRLGRFLAVAGLAAPQRYEAMVRLFPPGLLGAPPLSGKVGGIDFPASDAVTAAMELDRHTYLPDDLHTKVDRASMRVGLEVRAPFMDHRLVEFAAGLSSRELLRDGKKGVLRRAFAHELPGAVFSRKKMGFAVPIGEWFRSSLKPMAHDLILSGGAFCSRYDRGELETILRQHETQEADHSQRIFALVMLELWHRGRVR